MKGYMSLIPYLTGFFDGEGCIRINDNGSIQLSITNTNKDILEKFSLVFGGKVKFRSKGINKPLFSWNIYGQEAYDASEEFVKYSIDKLSQFQYLIEFWEKRKRIPVVRIPNKRGAFSNPERCSLVEEYKNKMYVEKWEPKFE